MEDKQILEAILHEIKDMKADMNDMKADIRELNVRTANIEERTANIEQRTTKIEVILENETNKNIQLLMEGHAGLVQKIDSIQNDTSRIEKMETELFATKEVTKENVQNIKKITSQRKI